MDEGHIRLHPFDPDSGPIPEIAEFGPLAERSEGRGIILIAVPDVETPAWCARAAAALASKWSAQGARILLVDVSLTKPVLHEVFDLPNSEGITDVIVNDAQLRTVGRTVGSPKFPFISAGIPTGDVVDVMRSARWGVVLQALHDAHVHLVMYAPADLPGLDALLARNPAVLLLGGNPEAAAEATGPLGLSESVGLGPPTGVPSTQFRVLELVGASSDAPTNGTDSTEASRKESYLRGVPLWKIGVALGLLVLLAWAGSRVLNGEPTGSSEGSEEAAESVVAEEPAESAVPEVPAVPPVPTVATPPETSQAYSLSLAAFEDLGVAVLRAEALAGRRADVLFTTVPVMVSDRVFYRLLAGPVTDSAAAEELRTSLSGSLSGEDSSVWIVRATPLAFDLGEYESREAADLRAEQTPASVAPYVFEVGAADRPMFRVYAGAFADSAEASVAYARFAEAGEEMPQLVRRVGRYVARP